MLNWTSSTEISSTGRTDTYSIGASDGCRKIRRPGIGARLSASRDQVKKEVKHRLNRRCQVKHRCNQRTMFRDIVKRAAAKLSAPDEPMPHRSKHRCNDVSKVQRLSADQVSPEEPTPKHRFNRWFLKLLRPCQRSQRLLQSAV